MKNDTEITIFLLNKEAIIEKCNYNVLLSCINDEGEYLMTKNYIIPKINISYIKTKKDEEDK